MYAYFTIACNERDNKEISEEYDQKAIKIASNILDKCVIDSLRYGAMQVLIYTYCSMNKIDLAKEIVEKLPEMYITKEWLLPNVLTGNERIVATQQLFKNFVDMFYHILVTTYGRAEVGKRDKELLKYEEFLDIVYEEGDYGFEDIRLYDIYCRCATDQAQIQNKVKTEKYLNRAFNHLTIFLDYYNEKNIITNSSFLVDRCEDDPSKWSFSDNPNISYKNEMLEMLKKDIFDFIRDDTFFVNLVNKLKMDF